MGLTILFYLSLLVIFGMWALAVFLIVKTVAILAKKIYSASTGDTPSEAWSSSLIFAVCAAISLCAPVIGCQHLKAKRYEAAIPATLEVTDLIYYSEEGPNENCGAAIFKLSPDTVAKIRGQGLVFFKNSTWGRGMQSDHLYKTWHSTPVKDMRANASLRGYGCLTKPPEGWQDVLRAVKDNGSFVAHGSGYDLLVVPELSIVVLSFDG